MPKTVDIDSRMLYLVGLAGALGVISGGAAYLLVRTIGLITGIAAVAIGSITAIVTPEIEMLAERLRQAVEIGFRRGFGLGEAAVLILGDIVQTFVSNA